jgi:uncharacterized protein YndB with AHSA1/START domain
MGIEFEVSAIVPASPEQVFNAWLDTQEHSEMTGGEAEASSVVGESFRAWDGYIQGQNLELEPPKRILQSWRTAEFAEGDPDSALEITFEAAGDETRITIRHSGLPEHGMQYKQGWVDSYFTPMQAYFAGR